MKFVCWNVDAIGNASGSILVLNENLHLYVKKSTQKLFFQDVPLHYELMKLKKIDKIVKKKIYKKNGHS